MSVSNKIWNVQNADASLSTIEKLMVNRGLASEKEKELFFNGESQMHSPFLLKDMQKAVDRIFQAIAAGERIMIFGDYDVDGISSTAIMMYTLKLLGAQVSYRLPHRVHDGYGLNMKFIQEFSEIGIGLVVTVDCGISCGAEVSKAKENGIDVIITDHHTIPPIPPEDAYAILHPLQKKCSYPFKGLVGAGVALKFAEALIEKSEVQDQEEHKKLLMMFASMGTVADLGPLLDENRAIVKVGLKHMKAANAPGIRSLKKVAGLKEMSTMTAMDIGFRIGPRINAAGRIGNPYLGVKLLLAQQEESDSLAEKLDELNRRRQLLTQQAVDESEDMINKQLKDNTLLIVHSPNWHTGIVGLLAGKITEKHARPAIVMEERETEFVGSARSPEFFSIIDALRQHSSLLTHFGGHKQAAGFTLQRENFEAFVTGMQSYANNMLEIENLKSTITIDCELSPQEISFDLLKEIKQFEPFGVGNREPIFVVRSVHAKMPRRVGNNKQHLQFSVEIGEKTMKTIAFNMGEHFDYILEQKNIDVVFALHENIWNNTVNLQLRVIDFQ